MTMTMIENNQAVIINLHHCHHQEPEDDHDNDKDRSSRPQRWRLHLARLQPALHLPVLRLSLLLQDLLPHLHPRPLPRPPRPPRPPLPHRASPQLKTGAAKIFLHFYRLDLMSPHAFFEKVLVGMFSHCGGKRVSAKSDYNVVLCVMRVCYPVDNDIARGVF